MQENMLTALSGESNIVQSCASGRVQIFQTEWHAIIIKPYGRLLDHGDSPKLYAQATYDVAVALQLCAERCIAHRDVTSNNIIVYNDRGVLCDFSAAKVSEECATLPWCIKYACIAHLSNEKQTLTKLRKLLIVVRTCIF